MVLSTWQQYENLNSLRFHKDKHERRYLNKEPNMKALARFARKNNKWSWQVLICLNFGNFVGIVIL